MYTHDFAIYCKSFRDDFDRLQILLDSLVEYKNESPMLLSVPSTDLSFLGENCRLPNFVTIVEDEAYTIPGTAFPQGWFQQQVCKLSVHRTNFAKSYAMIDSDTYFINSTNILQSHCDRQCIIASNIFTKYFPGNDNLVGYIMSSDGHAPMIGELKWNENAPQMMLKFKERISEIESLDPNDRGVFIEQIFDTPKLSLQPSQFFHSNILADFESFLDELGINFYDCIRISPWEYNWYASYALTKYSEVVRGVCSPILHFASESDVSHAKSLGINMKLIRKRFTAVQMAARHFLRINFED